MKVLMIRKLFYGLWVIFLATACSESGSQNPTAASPKATSLEAQLTVYKTPTCGCCKDWVVHLEKFGLPSSVINQNTLDPLKTELGIPQQQRSCHTALTLDGKYFFEGHIPAHVIKAFLAQPPNGALGLAVPGMPLGSPGMEMGEKFTPYTVNLINSDGTTQVFARVETQQSQYQ